eukprot:5399458-Prymnesium_polylepis.1
MQELSVVLVQGCNRQRDMDNMRGAGLWKHTIILRYKERRTDRCIWHVCPLLSFPLQSAGSSRRVLAPVSAECASPRWMLRLELDQRAVRRVCVFTGYEDAAHEHGTRARRANDASG